MSEESRSMSTALDPRHLRWEDVPCARICVTSWPWALDRPHDFPEWGRGARRSASFRFLDYGVFHDGKFPDLTSRPVASGKDSMQVVQTAEMRESQDWGSHVPSAKLNINPPRGFPLQYGVLQRASALYQKTSRHGLSTHEPDTSSTIPVTLQVHVPQRDPSPL